MPDAIPHEALARAVRAAFGAGARIVAAERLFGDASSRRYVRLRLADGGAPPTVVAMLLGADRFPLGSDELGERAASDELPFVSVARYLAARGFPVPIIHRDAAASDSLLLLEDIGDTTLWAAASAHPADVRPLFAAAVDLLAAFQVAGARHPDPSCLAFRRRFEGRLAALDPLARPFEQGAPVLVHRDFMAWNLHVRDGLHLIDFQDALLGPDAYDLAALLTDRTTGTLVTAALEAELIRHFVRARAAAALPVEGDLAARYRLCALHRALKVIGRFYYLERVLGKPGYLAYLPGVYAVARRMLDALPELASVRARLAAHVPELG